MVTDLAAMCRSLALDLVARPSVTGTAEEASFGPWLVEYLRGWAERTVPAAEVWSFPVGPGDGRHVVALLLRGSGARTVVLTGHYDTVTVDDYGDLAPLAGDPDRLRDALLARLEGATTAAARRVQEDLASGTFLPGRGLLDMKCGLAAGLAALASIGRAGFAGNLLFLAVPDEENASAGARAAAAELPGLASARGLQVAAVINLDAIADDGDGSAGRRAPGSQRVCAAWGERRGAGRGDCGAAGVGAGADGRQRRRTGNSGKPAGSEGWQDGL